MKILSFISNTAILFFILIIILYGFYERKNVLNLFIEGVVEGSKIVYELFPTLLALIVAVGMLNKSGFMEFFSNLISPLFQFLRIEKGLSSLIIFRPISGSTSTAIVTALMKKYGVDSKIGIIASCIMGSTETTIYVVSIYCSKIKVKKIKEVIMIGLICDFIGVVASCAVFELGIMRI